MKQKVAKQDSTLSRQDHSLANFQILGHPDQFPQLFVCPYSSEEPYQDIFMVALPKLWLPWATGQPLICPV